MEICANVQFGNDQVVPTNFNFKCSHCRSFTVTLDRSGTSQHFLFCFDLPNIQRAIPIVALHYSYSPFIEHNYAAHLHIWWKYTVSTTLN